MILYTTAINDLRTLLGDTCYSKRASKKGVVGQIDGVNVDFVTYDKRVIPETFQVYLDNSLVQVVAFDPISGEFVLQTAPLENSKLKSSYYFNWWLDADIVDFLNKGAQACSLFDPSCPEFSYEEAPPGLRQPMLYFAAHDANRALVQYLLNRRHAEEFLIQQDGNDDENYSKMIEALMKQAKEFYTMAMDLRDDYYKRQGRRDKPSFAIKTVRQRKYGPNR